MGFEHPLTNLNLNIFVMTPVVIDAGSIPALDTSCPGSPIGRGDQGNSGGRILGLNFKVLL